MAPTKKKSSINHRITKLFIANRGEIAARVQRAAQALGIPSVTGVSDADRQLAFAKNAEELALLGGGPASESYLNVKRILECAKASGCNALHPGYGFLSENADFADAVRDAGMIWVGPPGDAIRRLGSKTAGRECAIACGVPITPGTEGGLDDVALVKAAAKIGFPVLIKAVGGGGGRGMRIVRNAAEMPELLSAARGEGQKFFANRDVYLEKFIELPRHVEVQVVGDSHGNVIHLGTRDCSTQRRNQKLIEEAPAPNLPNVLRGKIHDAALKISKRAGYQNAGTLEFLVKDGKFYFLEMNTRIQVEHPITEEVTGIDLVQLQLRVAQGEELPYKQSNVKFKGHAIEFRVNAEDPAASFQPSFGTVSISEAPKVEWVRVDSGFASGDSIPRYYDNLISKVIIKGATRQEALKRGLDFLGEYKVDGVPTTIPFFRWMLRNEEFFNGPVDIRYLERVFNAECMRDLAAAELRDPQWKAPQDGCETVERVKYVSKSRKREVLIEIAHRAGAVFCASAEIPGPIAKRSRLSNSRAQALRSLIDEVIER